MQKASSTNNAENVAGEGKTGVPATKNARKRGRGHPKIAIFALTKL